MSTTPLPSPIFKSQERVLCYHRSLIYEARVLKIQLFEEPNPTTGIIGPHYLVHYKGWKQTWDEWVPEIQLLKYNEANLATQELLQQTTPTNSHNGSSAASKPQHRSVGKDNTSLRSVSRKDGTRGTKRAREEDNNTNRPAMKLNVPEVLKSVLVDDREAVTKSNQLVTLVRQPNVIEVLSDFADYIKATKPSHLREPTLVIETVVGGLRNYFDKCLGTTLLYQAERVQYAHVRRQFWTGPNVVVGQEKEMSLIYGAEHLLRMLVSLPQIISTTNLDAESVMLLRDYVNELLVWMVQEKDRIFQKQYENATLNYQNLSVA